jgi:hypothetical protein
LPSFGSGVTVPPPDVPPPSVALVVPPSLLEELLLLPPLPLLEPLPPLPLVPEPAEPLPPLPEPVLLPPLPVPPSVPDPVPQLQALSVLSFWQVCVPFVMVPLHMHVKTAPAFVPCGHGDPFFESLPHAAATITRNAHPASFQLTFIATLRCLFRLILPLAACVAGHPISPQ